MPTEANLDPPQPAAPSGSKAGRGRVVLAVLLLVGLSRLWLVASAENIARDGPVYLHMGRELTAPHRPPAAHTFSRYRHHPGYPYLLAVLSRLTGAAWPDGWVLRAQLLSVAMGLAAVAAVYALAAMTFGRQVALLAALTFGLGPRFSHIASDVEPEAMALGLGLWALVAAMWARQAAGEGRWRAVAVSAAAGALGGAAYLTRPEYLLVPLLAVVALLSAGRLTGRKLAVQLSAICAAVVVAAACAGPYVWTIGGLTLKNTPLGQLQCGPGDLWVAAKTAVAPPGALQRVLDRLARGLGPAGSVAAGLALLTWAGMYGLRLRLPAAVRIVPPRPWAILALVASLAAIPVLVALEVRLGPRYVSTRHALLLAGVLAPLVGVGILIAAEWFRLGLLRLAPTLGRARSADAALIIALLAALGGQLPRALKPLHAGKAPSRLAGVLLRKVAGEGCFVAGPNSWVPFYAGAPAEQFTEGTDMPFVVSRADVASAQALLQRLARPDPRRQYRFLALDGKLMARARAAGLLERLPAGFLTPMGAVEDGRDKVYLFSLSPRPGSPGASAPGRSRPWPAGCSEGSATGPSASRPLPRGR